MLWLGLFLPRLPIEVFLRGEACDPPSAHAAAQRLARRRAASRPPSEPRPPAGIPLAVCDRLRVLQASDGARALGVQAGMKRATALALAPGLALVERDVTRERDALRQLAVWALQFTPAVSLQDSGLLLEVEASLRLFGGRDALLARIGNGLAQLGFSAQIACAPTATAAWLLASHRDGIVVQTAAQLTARLASLPLSRLDAARPHLETLESIGARVLGDLLQLPRAGLARRFGSGLLEEIDRAFGRRAEPRVWFEAPARFDARIELLAQVENAEALLFAARRLLVQLGGWLAARQAAVSAVELVGEHDDRAPTTLSLRLASPSRDVDRLCGLLRETLAVTRLAAPVHTLRLHCSQVSPLPAANGEIFPVPACAHESLGRLVERLQARLGREQVQRLALASDHRPEAAYRVEAVEGVDRGRTRLAACAPHAGEPWTAALPRPLWLLGRPLPLDERANRPYWNGPLTLLAGPERIESGWWDDALVQRDYFIASDESGVLLWIYRERLADAQSRQGWFLQGRFG